MIKYKKYAITFDSEYPIVNTLRVGKEGKSKGVEIITPLYFPRDLRGSLKILYRLTETEAGRMSKDFKEVAKLLKENHREFMKMLAKLDAKDLIDKRINKGGTK